MSLAGTRGASAGFVQAQARLAADRRFQFDFAVIPPEKPPAWLGWLGRALQWLGPVAPWLFWCGLAAGVLFILFLVGRELLRSRDGARTPPKVLDRGGFGPSPRRAKALLAEADALAAGGRFGEAVRMLLLRTLDDIAERRPGLIAPDQTSREIAALDALPVAARQPLSRIAASVERFLFAGRPLDAETFHRCRDDYGRFVAAAS